MNKSKTFTLTATIIKENHENFIKSLKIIAPDRYPKLEKMYNDYGEERLLLAPASSYDYFHNSFPGGYLDHILRVTNYAKKIYENYKTLELDLTGFTLKELLFAALHHDLGKLGYPKQDSDHYVINQSEWHKENQGKMYSKNELIPEMPITDRSLFVLQQYEIPVSINEFISIKISDGLYDDANKQYMINFNLSGKLRNNMPMIIHHADMCAARYEFERWNKFTGKLKTNLV